MQAIERKIKDKIPLKTQKEPEDTNVFGLRRMTKPVTDEGDSESETSEKVFTNKSI